MKNPLRVLAFVFVAISLVIIGSMFKKADSNFYYIQTSPMGYTNVIDGDGEYHFLLPTTIDIWAKEVTINCDSIVVRKRDATLDTISYVFNIQFDTQVDKLFIMYRGYDNFVKRVKVLVKDKAQNSIFLNGEYISDNDMKDYILNSIVDDLKQFDIIRAKYKTESRLTTGFPFFIFL